MNAGLKNVLSVAGSAVASVITSTIIDPSSFNVTPQGLKHLAIVALLTAVVAVAHLYQNKPGGQDAAAASDDPTTLTKTGTALMLPLLFATLVCGPLAGCTQAQRVGIAQEIVNWTPAFTSAIDTAGNAAELLLVVDPGAALIVKTVVTGVDLLAPQFVVAAKAYLANPSQTTLQVLQSLIVQIQNSVNAQLLAAAKITNTTSQQQVLTAINGIGTIVNTLLGLIQSVSSTAQLRDMSGRVTVTLAMVQRQLDRNALEVAAQQVSTDLQLERTIHVSDWLQSEMDAGF